MRITTHKLFGHRDVLREVRTVADPAARLVQQHVRGRLPRTEIVLTTPRGLAELDLKVAAELVREATPQARAQGLAAATAADRDLFGKVILNPHGGALVLLSAPKLHRCGQVAATVVHELVHAVQLNRFRARATQIRVLRHVLDVEPFSRREERAFNRQMDADEAEAYRIEALASQLTRIAA